jgi:hypothetical protein
MDQPTEKPVPMPNGTDNAPAAVDAVLRESPPLKHAAVFTDTTGKPHQPLGDAGQKATLLFFVLHDCPAANSYAPEINRIAAEYRASGVRSFVVYAEKGLPAEKAAAHCLAYKFPCPALLDPDCALAATVGATHSPEAAIIGPWGDVLYCGRIDDRFESPGKSRAHPTSHDLRMAIDSVTKNQPIIKSRTEAVGCDLEKTTPKAPDKLPPTVEKSVTFHAHISPILQRHCAVCHQEGEIGPFPLLTYQDARKRSRLIAELVRDGTMPPWHADAINVPFSNDRRLSPEEIALVTAWHAQGALEGEALPGQAQPQQLAATHSMAKLDKPDLSLTSSETFDIPAEGPDFYHYFKLPTNLAEDKWATAIELRPTARRAVHHILIFVESRLPEGDAKASTRRYIGAWAPGGGVLVLDSDLAFLLPKGSSIVLQVHFHPNGKSERENLTVRLKFASGPPQRTWFTLQVPPVFGVLSGLCIPPGEANFVLRDSIVLPADSEAFGVGGHAHFLARRMRMTATLPDGSTRLLLRIRDWNFAWQEQYHYAQRIPLPAGTRLETEILFDNSAANPRNPSKTPREVRWGQQTVDEMGSITVGLVPAKNEDAPLFRRAQEARVTDLLVENGLNGGANLPFTIPKDLKDGLEKLKSVVRLLDRDKDGKLTASEHEMLRQFILASKAPARIVEEAP